MVTVSRTIQLNGREVTSTVTAPSSAEALDTLGRMSEAQVEATKAQIEELLDYEREKCAKLVEAEVMSPEKVDSDIRDAVADRNEILKGIAESIRARKSQL